MEIEFFKSEKFRQNRKEFKDEPETFRVHPGGDYVQMTYDGLRAGPKGTSIAGWDHTRGCWTVPVKEVDGEFVLSDKADAPAMLAFSDWVAKEQLD